MTPLQKTVHDIQVQIEQEQRPRLARCLNHDERIECIRAHADVAWKLIDAVSQQHGMRPMEWRVAR